MSGGSVIGFAACALLVALAVAGALVGPHLSGLVERWDPNRSER